MPRPITFHLDHERLTLGPRAEHIRIAPAPVTIHGLASIEAALPAGVTMDMPGATPTHFRVTLDFLDESAEPWRYESNLYNRDLWVTTGRVARIPKGVPLETPILRTPDAQAQDFFDPRGRGTDHRATEDGL